MGNFTSTAVDLTGDSGFSPDGNWKLQQALLQQAKQDMQEDKSLVEPTVGKLERDRRLAAWIAAYVSSDEAKTLHVTRSEPPRKLTTKWYEGPGLKLNKRLEVQAYECKEVKADLLRLARCVDTDTTKYIARVITGTGNRVDLLRAFREEELIIADQSLVDMSTVLDSFDKFQRLTMTRLVSKALDVPETVANLVFDMIGTTFAPYGMMRIPELQPEQDRFRNVSAETFGLFHIDYHVLRTLWKKYSSLPPFSTDFWFQTNWNYTNESPLTSYDSDLLMETTTHTYFFYKTFELEGVEQYFGLVVQETKEIDYDDDVLLHDFDRFDDGLCEE